MEEIYVGSWNELNDRLYEDAYNPELGRTRAPYAFRGLADVGYPLSTALMRLGGDYAEMEQHLLRNFRKYARRDVVEQDSNWDWLAVAQHHGLPTRLLDWTFSPLVAMHFATGSPNPDAGDGVVWMVDFGRAHERVPASLRQLLQEEGSEVFTVEMLDRVARTLSEFDSLAGDEFLLFFEPPSVDDRITNQFALFSVLSSATLGFGGWAERHPELCRKVVIPGELKWEIRDRLDQANITERVLFPGLDGLSRWLTRYYTPRSPEAAGQRDQADGSR